jgi:alkaline phosphatase D
MIRSSNPDLLHARSDERGYTLLDVSPEAMRAEFRTTPFPAGSRDSLSTQAVFQVLRGQAGPLKA